MSENNDDDKSYYCVYNSITLDITLILSHNCGHRRQIISLSAKIFVWRVDSTHGENQICPDLGKLIYTPDRLLVQQNGLYWVTNEEVFTSYNMSMVYYTDNDFSAIIYAEHRFRTGSAMVHQINNNNSVIATTPKRLCNKWDILTNNATNSQIMQQTRR